MFVSRSSTGGQPRSMSKGYLLICNPAFQSIKWRERRVKGVEDLFGKCQFDAGVDSRLWPIGRKSSLNIFRGKNPRICTLELNLSKLVFNILENSKDCCCKYKYHTMLFKHIFDMMKVLLRVEILTNSNDYCLSKIVFESYVFHRVHIIHQ